LDKFALIVSDSVLDRLEDMKENQGEKNKIYQKYREVLEMPDLTEEELFKIHTHFMQFGRILYEYYLDSDNLKKVKALKKN
jgi:hypothetical protein